MSTRVFTTDGEEPQEDSWSTPNPISNTSSVEFQFSAIAENPGTPLTNPQY